MPRRRTHLLLPLQAISAIVALLTLIAWPPLAGRMLLVPLAPGDINAVVRIAVAGGATLVGAGPFPGSLVVIGDRSRITRHIPSAWIMITAAPAGGCGANRPSDRTA